MTVGSSSQTMCQPVYYRRWLEAWTDGSTAIVVGSRERAEAVAVSDVDALVWYNTDDVTPAEAWTTVISEAAAEAKPRVVLAANAPAARVLVGAIAARLRAAITSSVIAVTLEEDRVVVEPDQWPKDARLRYRTLTVSLLD